MQQPLGIGGRLWRHGHRACGTTRRAASPRRLRARLEVLDERRDQRRPLALQDASRTQAEQTIADQVAKVVVRAQHQHDEVGLDLAQPAPNPEQGLIGSVALAPPVEHLDLTETTLELRTQRLLLPGVPCEDEAVPDEQDPRPVPGDPGQRTRRPNSLNATSTTRVPLGSGMRCTRLPPGTASWSSSGSRR